MKRVIGILVFLTPVLWLVGAIGNAGDPSQPVGFIQLVSIAQVADQGSTAGTNADGLWAALRSNRRQDSSVGFTFPTTPVVVASSEPSEQDSPFSHFQLDSPVARLAHSWQFDWRTALDPRAPSSLLS